MATASELKVKVAKISTIVEYLEDEQINQIEKDILLQAVRELYSDILVTDTTTVVENSKSEDEHVSEPKEAVSEHVDENVAETVAAAVVPPVISVAFDDGEFDFSDLLKDKTTEENDEVQETNVETEIPVENVATEEMPAEEEVPVEEPEPEEENEEPESVEEFEDPENIEEVDYEEEFEEDEDDSEELEEAEPETSEEVEEEVQESESNFEETVTGDTEINYSFNEDTLQDEQPTVEEEPQIEEPIVNEPVVEETTVVEEEPVVEEKPIVDEPQVVAEIPTIEEPTVETPQNVEEKPVEQEKAESTHITLGEQLGQSRQSSLNDKFASNKPLEGGIGLKPISDIRLAIPLGERFRFTRMLFSGNGPAFDSTVAKLNEMSSIEEADNYVRTNFSWDMDSPVVADFMNIVRRRYL
ncbi:MAG: hypothetical protein J6T48_04215 [Bacteroidales bacterium]|nr:hypothetical protein [Bacteroidales bacterium]